MDRSVSAADANRNFSRLLREVREGKSYVVTAHGRPVARIVPATNLSTAATRARATLLDRLAAQPPIDVGRWSRDELYARDR